MRWVWEGNDSYRNKWALHHNMFRAGDHARLVRLAARSVNIIERAHIYAPSYNFNSPD